MSDAMYRFIVNMWKLNKIDEDYIYGLITDNFLTEDEAQEIFEIERQSND